MKVEIAKARLIQGCIVELIFLSENITLDADEVKRGWKKAKEISPDKKALILLKTGKWTLLDKSAIKFVMSELKTWPAVAIQVSNLGQRFMGQVVLNVIGKGDKIKLFNDEKKAKEWLKTKFSKA